MHRKQKQIDNKTETETDWQQNLDLSIILKASVLFAKSIGVTS